MKLAIARFGWIASSKKAPVWLTFNFLVAAWKTLELKQHYRVKHTSLEIFHLFATYYQEYVSKYSNQ